MNTIVKILGIIFSAIVISGCASNRPQVIVITSTFPPSSADTELSPPTISPTQNIEPPVTSAPSLPTLDTVDNTGTTEHIVQVGDTLSGIALAYNVSLNSILSANTIANPDLLEVGQVIVLPAPPTASTPTNSIISNAQLVRSPAISGFDVNAFLASQQGYIRSATDTVETRLADGSVLEEILTSATIIERVSLEYSVDPRILIAFLEYRAGWLSRGTVADDLQTHPIVSIANSNGFDRSGLYNQLSWLSNELNRAYYGWKYRGWSILEFPAGTRLLYDESLNAGTIALQYGLALNNSVEQWQFDVSPNGYIATYQRYFGDGFSDNIETIPASLTQPELTLPFRSGDVWRFTGGFHGGWGSGSAWSALDFAPPDKREDGDPFCYTSEFPTTAVSSGIIARADHGALVLDLDGDGNESTGWTILYLHISIDASITRGQTVTAGQILGYASCHGGFSSATHLHIARRYNGEWIPADCINCPDAISTPNFNMSDWVAIGLANQEYQGYMTNSVSNQQAVAEQGRNTTINEISW